jgi:hypothetical protein
MCFKNGSSGVIEISRRICFTAKSFLKKLKKTLEILKIKKYTYYTIAKRGWVV